MENQEAAPKHRSRRPSIFSLLAVMLVGLAAVLAWTGYTTIRSQKTAQTQAKPNAKQPAAATATPKTTLSNAAVTLDDAGHPRVTGLVRNNQKTTAGVAVQAVFYDKAGKVLGKAAGRVDSVPPNQTKAYVLTSNDNVTGYYEMKSSVDALY